MDSMKTPYAYQIIHVQLTDGLVLPHESAQLGFYLIFWYNQIPIGHLFIKPGEPISTTNLEKRCISIIQSTLTAYQLNQPDRFSNNYLESTLLPDPNSLQKMLKHVLERYQPGVFSKYVPITVIICTRNRPDNLQTCLESLQTMIYQPTEIIVVDNASTNSYTEKTVRQFKGVTYCREPRPGLDIARNTGILAAHEAIIAYVDDDVVVHPLWIYQVWETFTDTRVAAMTGLVIASELTTEAQLIFETHWSFNRGYIDNYYDSDYFNKTLPSGPPVWEIGAGANMAFRRTLFEEIGYFDERLDVGAAGCSGDSELWYRTLSHGHIIHYNPRAIVYHRHRQELAAVKKQLFNYVRGHTVAALIQQQQTPQAGYRRYLFITLPAYYFKLLREGFPTFPFRYRTLFAEIKGFVSGLLFYRKNRLRPS